jgi:serine/threonine protein kinase
VSDTPDDDVPAPAPRGGERTVMVSAADLAALHGEGRPTPDADPFGTPVDPFAESVVNPFATSAVDPFGGAVGEAPVFAPPPTFVPPPSAPPVATSAPGGAFVHGTPGGLVGMHLNDLFEIVRFIAQGGMGEVYEGRNLASNEKVAIKVILPQYAADEQFMALFRREASALERIGHDSLVKYRTLAFDRTNRINYLAIEYVSGPSMADVLTGDPADPAVVRRVLKRLATGLGAAHDAGVIHRDLSPDNLLLPDGNVERCKIIDFGIAKDTNPGEKSVVGEAFAGKFGYAAPEIFGKFKRQVGPWTDVYSLALVMIAYARGCPLDMGVTIVDALEARDTVPDLSSIAPDMQPVFAKMLAPDPAERFRSMDEVVAAIDAPPGTFAAAVSPFGEASSAPPHEATDTPAFVRAATAKPVSASQPAKKSSLPLYGGIAAVVLVAAGGGYALLGGKGTPAPGAATPASAPVAEASALPVATPVVASAATPDWATARLAVLSALSAVSCSDLRVAQVPSGKTVHLAGWHPAGVSIPETAGGLMLDSTDTVAVAQPAAATCALLAKLRAAVPPGAGIGFSVAARQTISIASAPKGPAGWPAVDLALKGNPEGLSLLQITTIEDSGSPTAKDWVSSGPAQSKADLAKLEFEPKPSRFLAVVVASAVKPAPVTAAGADGVASVCSGGKCAMTSGWIEITR